MCSSEGVSTCSPVVMISLSPAEDREEEDGCEDMSIHESRQP